MSTQDNIVSMPEKKTAVPKPPRSRLGESLPELPQTPSNLTTSNSSKLADMNFKVSEDEKYEIDLTAAHWKMSRKDLILAAYRLWVEKHGDRPPAGYRKGDKID